MNFEQFEKKLNIVFKNKNLLKQSFIHRSYLNENKNMKIAHNERLEFLGDAVLELVVTEYLYGKYPKKTEGDLTSYRAALVNTITLASVANLLDMNNFLLLSKGEAKDIGRARQYILANTFESFVGALYLDQGYNAAKDFIAKNLFPLTNEIVEKGLWQDSKSRFQEVAQEKVSITPQYKTIQEIGPDHEKNFIVGVYLDEDLIGEGEGKSKQEAEQSAARKALLVKGWD
ncbi:ribonuclease III [Candidatus Campbellbacteria bacterium CG10_big_fil_rev_8_21_14_0_10_35_52]|uniref:Ribonuclease 3 n=1 Tax=Candidatus Campbellbacteria bacterium CG10_big_fil_rev_8_21_14_0_10_35_52 TaxID=1974527 RepID=A0A2M6WW27_9BACT|nr:MAG: ribonuclease III [Candidatus Campbellbacteria bacterium CG10_big_fil_rev_8_21_14_0_10_35_52]